MPEQLAFDHRLGQRPGIDRHERPAATAGKVVQRASYDLFARAGFAEDEHVGLGPGERADLFAQPLHGRRLAEQAGRQLLTVGQGQA